jgi:hypothetical protein
MSTSPIGARRVTRIGHQPPQSPLLSGQYRARAVREPDPGTNVRGESAQLDSRRNRRTPNIQPSTARTTVRAAPHHAVEVS